MVHEIQLIKIHERRLRLLEQKRAKVGSQAEVTLEIEIEDIKHEIGQLEQELKRRWLLLKQKDALYGFSADPSITIEIEDIEAYFKSTPGGGPETPPQFI
jgi:hypothetical protein